jgi:hypothetical protein
MRGMCDVLVPATAADPYLYPIPKCMYDTIHKGNIPLAMSA